jgi:hypothetical protein
VALLRFYLASYGAGDPFTAYSVSVVATDGINSATIPCESVTIDEIQEKKETLGQSMWDQHTVAAICADKLGVPVAAGAPA